MKKSNVYCTDWEKHQKISLEEFYSCRCSTTFLVEQETKKKNVWDVIQTRSSEDRKSLNVEQTHERTERLVATLNTADAKDSSRVRSSHESNTFNVEDEVLREREWKDPLLIRTRVMSQ